MTFPARLTELLDAIKNEKDPIKRFAYVQQMDALLVNHAEALRDLVEAARIMCGQEAGDDLEAEANMVEALAKLEEQ